ncbi:hypothetical protein RRG08_042299 [Elysia crispata]|uniref:Uncharacterized protein n=1 Tax=Elysia crispata TaxID=231223 RepID=A0AAE1DYT0_9GAST|nr:hypothetical protein RRG08_042299 [Elysia crispata]
MKKKISYPGEGFNEKTLGLNPDWVYVTAAKTSEIKETLCHELLHHGLGYVKHHTRTHNHLSIFIQHIRNE